MPIRIPTQSIVVHRDGKAFTPPIGRRFNFTQDELDHINKVNPHAVRKAINETVGAVVEAPNAIVIDGQRIEPAVVQTSQDEVSHDEAADAGAEGTVTGSDSDEETL